VVLGQLQAAVEGDAEAADLVGRRCLADSAGLLVRAVCRSETEAVTAALHELMAALLTLPRAGEWGVRDVLLRKCWSELLACPAGQVSDLPAQLLDCTAALVRFDGGSGRGLEGAPWACLNRPEHPLPGGLLAHVGAPGVPLEVRHLASELLYVMWAECVEQPANQGEALVRWFQQERQAIVAGLLAAGVEGGSAAAGGRIPAASLRLAGGLLRAFGVDALQSEHSLDVLLRLTGRAMLFPHPETQEAAADLLCDVCAVLPQPLCARLVAGSVFQYVFEAVAGCVRERRVERHVEGTVRAGRGDRDGRDSMEVAPDVWAGILLQKFLTVLLKLQSLLGDSAGARACGLECLLDALERALDEKDEVVQQLSLSAIRSAVFARPGAVSTLPPRSVRRFVQMTGYISAQRTAGEASFSRTAPKLHLTVLQCCSDLVKAVFPREAPPAEGVLVDSVPPGEVLSLCMGALLHIPERAEHVEAFAGLCSNYASLLANVGEAFASSFQVITSPPAGEVCEATFVEYVLIADAACPVLLDCIDGDAGPSVLPPLGEFLGTISRSPFLTLPGVAAAVGALASKLVEAGAVPWALQVLARDAQSEACVRAVWLALGSLAAVIAGEESRDKIEYLQGVLHATDPMEQILQVMELECDRSNPDSWVGKYQRSALRLLGLACCRGGVLLGEQTENILSSLSKHIVTNNAFPEDVDSLADALVVFHTCAAQDPGRKQRPAAETSGREAPDHHEAESVLVKATLDLGDKLDAFAALQPDAIFWLLGRVAESRPEECSRLACAVLQREMEGAAGEGRGGPLARWLLSPEGSDFLRFFMEHQISLLSLASDRAADGFSFFNSWATLGCSSSFECLQYLQNSCPRRLSHVPLQGSAAVFRCAVLRVSHGQEQQALVRTMLEFLHARIEAGVCITEDCSHLLAPVETLISACMENDAVDDGVKALAVDALTISQVKAAEICEPEARGGVPGGHKMRWVFLQQSFMGKIAGEALLKLSSQNSLRCLTSCVQYLAVSVSVHHTHRVVYADALQSVTTRSMRNRAFGVELAHLPLDLALDRLPTLCANGDAGLSAACLDLLAAVSVTDPKRYLVQRAMRAIGVSLQGSPASARRVAAAVANSIRANDDAVTLAATCAAAAVLQKSHDGLLQEVAHALLANWYTALVVGAASLLERLVVEQLPSLDEAAAASALLLAGVLLRKCPVQVLTGRDICSLTEALHKALPKWAWKRGLCGAVVTCLEAFHGKGLLAAADLSRRVAECLNDQQTPPETCPSHGHVSGGVSALRERLATPRLILTASRELPDPRVRLQAICTGGLGARTPVASGEAQRGGGGQALGPIAAREIAVGKSGFDEFWRVYGPVPSPERVPTASEKAAGASAPAPVPAPAAAAEVAVVGVTGAAADAPRGPPRGPRCIGWRVAVPSLNEDCFRRAVVTEYAPARFSVQYENGQRGEYPVEASPAIQWLAPPGTFRTPGEVPVVCRGQTGTFLLASMRVRLDDRSTVPPREFVMRAGYAKPGKKRWMVAIKVQQRNGTPGQALGEWLAKSLPGGGGSSGGQEEVREIQVVLHNVCARKHGVRAVFLLPSRMLRLSDSSTVTPSTFMKLFGEHDESWKSNIRIWNAAGALGSTLGDWLAEHSLQAPEEPRPAGPDRGRPAPRSPTPSKKRPRKAPAAGGARRQRR